jgi:CRP/FNR family transcriptional regulator, cyclic AMP receptor protein
MTAQGTAVLGAQLFLRGMSGDHLAVLAAASQHVAFGAGRRLFEEGQTADRFWLIDAGQVRIDMIVPGDGRVTIETLGRGDFLGLSWLLPPFQWRSGAMATQATEAFEFAAPDVRAACDADPVLGAEFNRRLSGVLARRLHATQTRLIDANARSSAAG